jgi:uncharacterized membrane protein (UPF0127 family)
VKLTPLIFVAFMLTGCHVNVDEPVANQPQNSSVPATPAAVPVAEKVSAKSAEDPQTKPGYNPRRIHQLGDLKTATLTINGHKLKTWIMDNDSLREEGMMFLTDKEVKPDETMLFVFPEAREQSFWMHNTLIPLDIAYIGADKKVVRATTMKALDESSVPSNGKALYALEMKKGTNDRLHIAKGTTVDIPASIKTAE